MRRAGDRAVNTGEPASAVLVPAPDFRRLIVRWVGHSFDSILDSVIPGWSEGPDLRCAIAHRGISRLQVRCFASPRNDGNRASVVIARSTATKQSTLPAGEWIASWSLSSGGAMRRSVGSQ